MVRPTLLAVVSLSMTLTGPAVLAADSPAETGTAGGTTSASQLADDVVFIREALQDGRRQIAISRETMTRTKREDVRSTAQMLMTEHMTLNAEFETLAGKKGWEVGPRSSPPRTQTPSSASAPSDDLDRIYVETQIREHERNIEVFRKQSTSAHDADVRALAADAVPKLEQHLAELRKLQEAPTTPGAG